MKNTHAPLCVEAIRTGATSLRQDGLPIVASRPHMTGRIDPGHDRDLGFGKQGVVVGHFDKIVDAVQLNRTARKTTSPAWLTDEFAMVVITAGVMSCDTQFLVQLPPAQQA